MIRHEAPCNRRANGREKPSIQGQEDEVILAGKENCLFIIALVVNMINIVGGKIHTSTEQGYTMRRGLGD